MMLARRLVVPALACFALGGAAACFTSSAGPGSPDATDDAGDDVSPGPDGASPDAPSATVDATVTDSASEAGDASAPLEAGEATTLPDASDAAADASDGGAGDATVQPDASDAGSLVDATDAGSPADASEAGEAEAGPTGGGPFLYFTDNTGSRIYGYTLAPATGALTAIDMDPVQTGIQTSIATENRPMGVAGYATGKFVYTAELNGNVGQYAVDPVTGVLTIVNRSVGDAGSRDFNVAGAAFESIGIDALGRVLYVPDGNNSVLYALAIDTVTGYLSLGGSIPVQAIPRGVGVDPAGHYLFVAGNGAPVVGRVALDVAGLPISPDSGGTSYVSLPGSGNCLGAALGPTGTSYTVCSQDQRIYGVAYDAGAMAVASVGYAAAGVSPIGVAAHPNGNFAYAASYSLEEISTFSTSSEGGAPTLVGTPLSVGYSCRTLAFDPTGAHLFAGCDSRILTFDVDGATGALTQSSSVAGPTDSSYAMAIVNP